MTRPATSSDALYMPVADFNRASASSGRSSDELKAARNARQVVNTIGPGSKHFVDMGQSPFTRNVAKSAADSKTIPKRTEFLSEAQIGAKKGAKALRSVPASPFVSLSDAGTVDTLYSAKLVEEALGKRGKSVVTETGEAVVRKGRGGKAIVGVTAALVAAGIGTAGTMHFAPEPSFLTTVTTGGLMAATLGGTIITSAVLNKRGGTPKHAFVKLGLGLATGAAVGVAARFVPDPGTSAAITNAFGGTALLLGVPALAYLAVKQLRNTPARSPIFAVTAAAVGASTIAYGWAVKDQLDVA